jgi:integrase
MRDQPVMGSIELPAQTKRNRVLSGPELAAVWNALDDDDYGKATKLLILTGCRQEEIGGCAGPNSTTI